MKNIFLLFTTFFLTIFLNAQVIQPWCSGSPSGGGPTALGSVASTLQNTNTYKVRVYLHIIQDGNGNGGVSITEAQQVVTDLNNYFSNTNADICFESAGITFLPSDDFYGVLSDRCIGGAPVPGTTDDNDVDELFNTNAHADGIDIYILPDEFNQNPVGLAQSIPGTAMYIGGRVPIYDNELAREIYTVPHEMGHCLGLFHPYHGTAQGANGIFCNGMICNLCSETGGPNGNGDVCGDFVEDTPPDPLYNPLITSFDRVNCEWVGEIESPDARNFMAFTWYECADQFTSGQVLRMKDFLENVPLMSNVVISKNSCTAPAYRLVSNQEEYQPLFNNSEWLQSGLLEIEGYLPVRFYEVGDTLILTNNYKVIIKENTSVEGLVSSPFHTGLRRDTSFMREDFTNKQVWRLLEDGSEELEFDFSLQIGANHPKEEDFILNAIDTAITPDGTIRKQFIFNREGSDFSINWVEGVGAISANNSLDGSSAMTPNLFNIWGLLCMTQNGNLIYNQGHINLGLPGGCANNITVDTRVATILDPALKVFPNPANNYLYLSSESLVGQEVDIVIHDLLGQRLSMQKVRLSKNHKISIDQLGKGAYILSISNNQGLQSLRFIKQ